MQRRRTEVGFWYEFVIVPQDNARAAAWYRKAADQGYMKAQYQTGPDVCRRIRRP